MIYSVGVNKTSRRNEIVEVDGELVHILEWEPSERNKLRVVDGETVHMLEWEELASWQHMTSTHLEIARRVVENADAKIVIEQALNFDIDVQPALAWQAAKPPCNSNYEPRDWLRIAGSAICLVPVIGVLVFLLHIFTTPVAASPIIPHAANQAETRIAREVVVITSISAASVVVGGSAAMFYTAELGLR